MLRMKQGTGFRIALLVCGALVLAAAPASAQVAGRDTIPVQESEEPWVVSPRGAMIRSWLVPGWGQAAAGSYVRGGVWFTVQGTSWYMLLKTLGKLSQARGIEDRMVAIATDSLNDLIATDTMKARELADSLAFEAAIAEHEGVNRIRGLVNAREQQRQDWITYTIFFTLISGVDAYVNAHLRDFPVDITTSRRRDGSVEFRLDLPLGSPRARDRLPTPSVPAGRLRQW
jgi:hypothetical protein